MDWKSIVTQLMTIERAPQDKAKTQVATLAKRQTALDSIKTSLTTLQTAAKGLSFGTGTSSPRSAKMLGTSTDATVTTADGAATGTFQVVVGANNGVRWTTDATGTSNGNLGQATGSQLYGAANAITDSNTHSTLLALTLADYGVTAGTVTIGSHVVTITAADLTQTVDQFFNISRANATGNNGTQFNHTDVALDATFTNVPTTTQDATTGAFVMTADPTDIPQGIGAAGDTSNFLSAMGFSVTSSGGNVTATQKIPASVLGNLKLDKLAGGAALGAAETLTINGVLIGTFNASTTSLATLVSTINQKTSAGVTASIDPNSQRLVLSSNKLGSATISLSANENLSVALGLRQNTTAAWTEATAAPNVTDGWFKRGLPMQYNLKYNGQLVTDASGNTLFNAENNEVDLSKFGFGSTKIQITPSNDITNVSSAQTYTAVVSGATEVARAKIDTFVSAYNSLRQLASDSTKITVGSDGKVTTSVLSDNKDVANLATNLRSRIFAQVTDPSSSNTSLSTSYDSIDKIGLTFDKTGTLSVSNTTLLEYALTNSPTAVDALLNYAGYAIAPATTTSTTTQGIGARISTFADTLIGTNGLFPTLTSSISSQTTRLQKQITDLTRSLTAKQKALENSFIAMEKAQSRFQSQSNSLTQAFNYNNNK